MLILGFCGTRRASSTTQLSLAVPSYAILILVMFTKMLEQKQLHSFPQQVEGINQGGRYSREGES